MPVVESKDAIAEQTRRANERRASRRAAREVKKDDTDITPMSEAQMLNLPRGYMIGSLGLKMVCPPIGRAGELQLEIFSQWPKVLTTAAAIDVSGEGIDPEETATALTAYNRSLLAQAGQDPEAMPPVTVATVAQLLAGLSMEIEAYLPTLLSHAWELASSTPGLAWPRPAKPNDWDIPPAEWATPPEGAPEDWEPEPYEPPAWNPAPPEGCVWLDEAVRRCCTVPDLADLLRAILKTMGGFPGDCIERFGQPS